MSICYTCACYPRPPCSSAGHCYLSRSLSFSLEEYRRENTIGKYWCRYREKEWERLTKNNPSARHCAGKATKRGSQAAYMRPWSPRGKDADPWQRCSIGCIENAQLLNNCRRKRVDAVESLLVNFNSCIISWLWWRGTLWSLKTQQRCIRFCAT